MVEDGAQAALIVSYQDVLILVVVVIVWAAIVLPDYALAQHLRDTLKTKSREKGLYQYARQGWESRFLVWGAISGGAAGALTTASLSWAFAIALVLLGLVGVLLIGFGSMLVASRAGFGDDIGDHPLRAVMFSALGFAVFLLSTLSVKLTRGPVVLAGWAEALTVTATVVGIAGGLVSIWHALRKT